MACRGGYCGARTRACRVGYCGARTHACCVGTRADASCCLGAKKGRDDSRPCTLDSARHGAESGPRLRLAGALGQIMPIERLSNQCLDYGLAAHVQIPRGIIQFLQHRRSQVHVHTLNRLNHAALTFEEPRNVLTFFGQPRNDVGRNRCDGFTSFLHISGNVRSGMTVIPHRKAKTSSPEGRQKIAHGASRRDKSAVRTSPGTGRKRLSPTVFRPVPGLCSLCRLLPTAYAVSYDLSSSGA